ncbi:MAG: hypothetical protein PHS57_08915 [Alphaproteobacteria bacterium]|nr:hypothetical protein [Alphaproteobacteria bacterium]
MKKRFLMFCAGFLLVVTAPAFARDAPLHVGPLAPAKHGPGRSPWHGDIHRFGDYDLWHWRAGHWFHGFHAGKTAWWWVTGDLWYSYPSPVYPYPDPFVPAGVVVEVPAQTAAVYYHCDEPEGYYPYVSQCPTAWKKIVKPITPPEGSANSGIRKDDYRQLNRYADMFYHVKSGSPSARKDLEGLARRLEAFRKTLLTRDYNAMSILRDVEDLKGKIDAKQKELRNMRSKGKLK